MGRIGADEAQKAEVEIPVEGGRIMGILARPADALGLVVFAHGSGSGRLSPRNQAVARLLRQRGLATLLVDLLTPEEERVDEVTREHRFDIPLLARRLARAAEWADADAATRGLALGFYGSSTGAAAALVAAAARPRGVGAVVSRGGRPDLAKDALAHVEAATLLIVGGRDTQVIGLNEQAMAQMAAPVRLHIVPGSGHLFEEPGALEEVAGLAGEWFAQHLHPEGHGAKREAPGAREGRGPGASARR